MTEKQTTSNYVIVTETITVVRKEFSQLHISLFLLSCVLYFFLIYFAYIAH